MNEISGGEFLFFICSYLALAFGGLLFRHHFEKRWWVCGLSTGSDLSSRIIGAILGFGIGGFFFHAVAFAIFHGTDALLDRCVWWALVLPGFWHGSIFLVAAYKYGGYMKNRKIKLGLWLEHTPPQSKDELTEYIKLTLDFPEFAVEENQWRDGEAEWSLTRYHSKSSGFNLRDERVTFHLTFVLFPGGERSGSVALQVSEWRQFRELILAGIHEEWRHARERAREEMLRKRQEAELAAIRREEEDRAAKQREREEVAALLEGRVRQVASLPTVVVTVQEETKMPEDHSEDDPPPFGYRPRAIEMEG